MVSGGGMTCVKFLMIAFNFLFWLAGLALIVIGSISQNDSTKIQIVNPAAVCIIVIGIIIFILAFLGCFGAWKENRCMLITFGVLMILILILVIAAIILAFVFKAQARDIWKKAMMTSLEQYDRSTPDANVFNWDTLQSTGTCCGVDNYTDWYKNKIERYSASNLPPSCCNGSSNSIPCSAVPTPSNQSTVYNKGCADTILSAIEYKYLIVGGVVAAVGVLMIIGAVFAFCLAQAIHKDYNVV